MHFAKLGAIGLLGSIICAYAASAASKVIIDNDGLTDLQVLFALQAKQQILGVTAIYGDYTLDDSLFLASDVLSTGNLTYCIPSFAGAAQPLLRTNNTFQIWQELYGSYVWQGYWQPEYETANTNNESYIYNTQISAAQFIIDMVKANPNEITIVAAGPMTNLAIALSIWPDLAKNTKSLVIMGGYVDSQIAQVTGGDFLNDMYSDFNLFMEPEAAQTAITADWPELIIAGNITSQVYPSQSLYNGIIARAGGMANIESDSGLSYAKQFVGNGTLPSGSFPFWDEVASAIAAWPEIVNSSYDAYVSVDTAYDSPFYGSLRMVPADLVPKKGVRTAKASMITGINVAMFYQKIYDSLTAEYSSYCMNGTIITPSNITISNTTNTTNTTGFY
ncbi:inosine-uridine preferring nucleoside hydrolase [Schizosaccharomyces pombe]|uniref:Uncharacterized protein C800.11 n=1 Tax=Schizosaccharomyces pombe (strain 972 / ATCC 24843) TaxID=284812 RepID=YHLB_SCHPO|nr:putative inosine-uridine-preferring nucleoside hydrolase [Schizosaccharomyces pombe]Q9HGL1.1 RecName: Full=Uncharacterized protein C800.11; Flags: Precursor [Schizosaccharomyces pombe 972h-]CAC01526.1 inosine-uridine preferring nucleoside hydrolase (predicted) [Schizosaccharomyces pombe]|eukprot:NP_595113.1 putative inosine-uridine-preferring nucleoside hydrolase [Schizosaccharomyces pombe]